MNSSDNSEKSLDKLRYKDLFETLKTELGLKFSPVAIKFFYTEAELDFFKKGNEFRQLSEGMSFCRWEKSAIEEDVTSYSEKEQLNCDVAACCFNWQEESGQKAVSGEQLSKSVFGVAAAPLADTRFIADTVNFYCDRQQAEILIDAWSKAAGVNPWQPEQAEERTVCNYTVYTHNMSLASVGSICPRSGFSAGDELVNVVLPADHLRHTVDQLLEGKLSLKKSSFNRPGDGFFRYTVG